MRIAAALLAASMASAQSDQRAFADRYCIACHGEKSPAGGLSLTGQVKTEAWERVLTRLRSGSMPPPGAPRPDGAAYRAVIAKIEADIDRAWAANPASGRGGAVQRLNRSEYNNAIRDLLALDIDVKPQLPGDETADGSFDNFADALSISTSHLERYMSVARQVTRLAVGLPPSSPRVESFKIPLHVLQDDRQSEDLPLGSRGGIAVRHTFPVTAEYRIKVRLQRQYQDYLKGIGWPQMLDVRLDGKLLKRFTVGGGAKGRAAAESYAGDGEPGFAGDPEWERYMQLDGDAGLEVAARVSAGPHTVGVSFVRQLFEPEGLPQPLQRGRVIANDQVYMDPANVDTVQIAGPYGNASVAQDTPSRRAIFVCQEETVECAKKILGRMARLAYRRPVTESDLRTLLDFFESGRRDAGFDSGIQFALERMLVDPHFLLRVQRIASRLSNLELASRLSFFLWRSVPDERLLAAPDPRAEAKRMMADPRTSGSLVQDFAAQWLNLRRVPEVVVDPVRYPNYDESLLLAFRQETEMFVESTIRDDRGVSDLLRANYTFVNERLARHYGLPGIYGSRFRRVMLSDPAQRGGLLAHGSLLAATSYPDRTSPVLRGKWLLNNILGLPVPDPPPGLNTTLESKPGAKLASIRERLAEHRKNPMCNSCHVAIDPLGFALENFDVIGGWRSKDEAGRPVDSIGTTPGGVEVQGLTGLRAHLLEDPEAFPRTVTAKLLAYALGRPLDWRDQPAVRQIVRAAAKQDYRWSAILMGIIESAPFLTRGLPEGSQ